MDIPVFIPDDDIEMLTYLSRPFFVCDKSGNICCVFGNIDAGIRSVLREKNFKTLLCGDSIEKFDKFNSDSSHYCSFEVKGVGVYNTALAVHAYENYPDLFNVLLYSVTCSLSPYVLNIFHLLECSVMKELTDIKQSGVSVQLGDAVSESGYRREGENVFYAYNRALLSYLYLSYPGFSCDNQEIFCLCDAVALAGRRIRAIKSFGDVVFDINNMRPTDMIYCDMTGFTLVLTALVRMLIDISGDRVIKFTSEKSPNTVRISTNAPGLRFIAKNILLDKDAILLSSYESPDAEEKCLLFKDVPEFKTRVGFIMNILSMMRGSLSYSRTALDGMFDFTVTFTDTEIPFLFENRRRDCDIPLGEVLPLLFPQ